MEFGALLKTFIYLISSSLLYPVLFLLSILVIWTILYAGSFCAEWIKRSRLPRVPSEQLPEKIQAGEHKGFFPNRVLQYALRLENVGGDLFLYREAVENLLQDTVQQIYKSLDRLRIVVRIAPGLGLIGTLIPMGTGLAALGQGDMSKLTSDLVIAFTTTVVGMALGLLAYVFWTVTSRWVEEDVKNIELMTEVLTKAQPEKDSQFRGQKNAELRSIRSKMAVHQG
jgi:biopolymer transport protein ExbB/TolQ